MLAAPVQVFLALLGAIAVLVLLTACANVANLFLARLARRRREVAVRLSLGAGRGRLVRQFLAETLLVALVGGALGTLLAYAATGAIASARLPLPVPVALDVQPDPRVLAFAVGLSLLTGLGLGLLPSLAAARGDVVPGLKDGAPARFGRGRLRGAFVVAQVALSLVLVCGAFLFLRGLGRAAAIDPGFDGGPVLAVPADLVLSGYDEARTVGVRGAPARARRRRRRRDRGRAGRERPPRPALDGPPRPHDRGLRAGGRRGHGGARGRGGRGLLRDAGPAARARPRVHGRGPPRHAAASRSSTRRSRAATGPGRTRSAAG